MIKRLTGGLGALLVLLAGAAQAQEIVPEDVEIVPRPAEIMPRASQSLLLDVAYNGAQYIAVGERGHVLASVDGKVWAQAPVPVRAPLTAVHFPRPGIGWAVGHDGVIIATRDGGRSWQLQHFDPNDEFPLVFLDVLFLDEQRGFAIGTYGLMIETRDGGLNWQDAEAPEIREEELHLNAMVPLADGTLLVVGETGMMGRSTDGGQTWERLESPYESSLFGALPYGHLGAVVFGLRGNAFVSDDVGSGQWRRIDTGTVASLFGGTRLADGGYALVGLNGTILLLDREARVRKRIAEPQGKPLAAAIQIPTGLLVVGEAGASVVPLD